MEDNLYSQLKELINLIDLKKINHKLIKSNIKKLIKVYEELKKIWDDIEINHIKYDIIDNQDKKYIEIINILNKNFLSDNQQIKKIISNTKYIHSLSYSNINFYWISETGIKKMDDKNYLMSIEMFKISLSLNLYKFGEEDNILRYIIWLPIDKKRNFFYNKINKSNLNKSQEEFLAFVASGVTFGIDPKITIITRYEEVEKLLIHELIHNFNMDGSEFHNQLEEVLLQYNKVKNKGNYHYDYSIYESYTEILSTYLYLLFVDIKLGLYGKILKDNLVGQILLELIYSYNIIANLIDLNGYSDYNQFRSKLFFRGNICKYEYYYIKALMYNNFILKFGNDTNDFKCIYTDIIEMIKKIQNKDDLLMELIYNNHIIHKNFKYQIH
jgi:hypothetical protein